MTTTTDTSTEAQAVRMNTAAAVKLAARATDLSLVNVTVDRFDAQLSFRTNADAAKFAMLVGAVPDERQNDHEAKVGGRASWWVAQDERVRVVGWGQA